MTDLEKGRDGMSAACPGVKAPEKVLVIVARNGNDTKALTKDLKTLRSLVAVAESPVLDHGLGQAHRPARGSARVRAVALLRQPQRDERRQVIAHELVHAALANRTVGAHPAVALRGHRACTCPATTAPATPAR